MQAAIGTYIEAHSKFIAGSPLCDIFIITIAVFEQQR
jgi:hypothetical protein